jgi:cyanate permease
MEQFRRPLGILIAGMAVALLGFTVVAAQNSGSVAVSLTGWAASIGLLAALGALGVIVWRLVRKA